MSKTNSSAPPLARIESLRRWRVRDGDQSVAGSVQQAALQYEAVARDGSSLATAWASLAPEAIGRRVAPERVSRGVLVLRAPDAADQHAAARWLRGGGALALQRSAGVAIRRWRFVYAR